MKKDLQTVKQKSHLIRQAHHRMKDHTLRKMLTIYYLGVKKNNQAKVLERLKYIHMLNQTLPVIKSLIENGGNSEVVLELIQNSNEVIS